MSESGVAGIPITMPVEPMRQVRQALAQWTRRWRFAAGLRWALGGVQVGLAAGLAVGFVARLRPLMEPGELLARTLALTATLGALALIGRWSWPVPRLRAARYFDRHLGLAERISAALELAEAPASRRPAEIIVQQQWQDAARAVRAVDPRRLRLPPGRGQLLTLIALSLGLTALLLLPNPMQALLAQQRAVESAVQQEVARIEAIREEIQQDTSLTEEQRQSLLGPLDRALEQLSSQDLTQEQAVSALTTAEQALQALSNPDAVAVTQALQRAGQNLDQGQGGPMDAVARSLSEGDVLQAAEDLAALDVDQMTPAERDALAQQLSQSATDVAATDPELAQQLQAAAEALQEGDNEAAEQALEKAADAMRQAAHGARQALAAEDAAGQMDEASQAVAMAGQEGAGQDSRSQSDQGQAGAQGQGNNDGATGQNSGAGHGDGKGEATSGQAGSDPIETNNGMAESDERVYEPIYSPQLLGESDGQDVSLPGSDQAGDQTVGTTGSEPTSGEAASVPYNQVYEAYQQALVEAMQLGQVPIGLRSLVRDYFSALQPT